ncbi:hypothetical protein BJX68DRAFT_260422 [Aspergillus pseudodeflectus]|uniref:Uncharacterized protein n=1 Tax=Aspergillus pseudodeflectus TaxID=176178 RepID=A0ABR4LAP8_9EURO
MPTTTATLSWTITNWGPLTTPWSLPSACSNQVFIYETDGPLVGILSLDPPLVGLYAQCDNGLFTCYPEPTDPNAPSVLSEASATPTLGGSHAALVYSPAPACPEGWETVGAVGRAGDGPSVSRAGLFTVPYEADPGVPGPQVAYKDALASLLDPSETAVMCCPSSMTIHNNLIGGCRSSLQDYSISTACVTYFPVAGMSRTDVQSSMSAGLISWMTETTTYSASDVPSLVAEAVVQPLVLLHKPTDLAGGSGEGSGDSGEDTEGSTAEEDPSETNAAASLRGGNGVWV